MKFLDLKVIAAPALLPVTVDEFVNHARLNGLTVDRQPELIDRELSAATLRAEQYLRRSLITQTLAGLYTPEDSAAALLIVLPRGDVQEVLAVESAGVAVDPASYSLDWNTITLTQSIAGRATVEWISGYGDDPDDVPALIREGILQYATVLYEDRSGAREAKYQASADRTLPAGVVDTWRPFQIEVGG
jgi:uncharacterized phiE125 gp8 family phage protein